VPRLTSPGDGLAGLTIVVAGNDPERFHAALAIAAANAALGARSRIYLHAAAAVLADRACPAMHGIQADGVPTLGELLDEALAIGVEIIVCQSGLAAAGISAETVTNGIATGGLIELLSTLAGDQLLMA
jgi:predicted peroxiredoxin